MNNWKMVLGVILGGMLLMGIMVWGLTKMGGEESLLDVGVEKLVEGAGWLTGEVDYKVTVVEFSDLQCSACKHYKYVYEGLKEMEGVRYVFRHFPLLTIHKNSWKAAKVAEVAKKMGRGWEMKGFLFEKQEEWAETNSFDEKSIEYAKELGLDEVEFNSLYKSSNIEEQIVRDNLLAKEIKLSGTPTFFVEGKQVAADFVLSKVKEILDSK